MQIILAVLSAAGLVLGLVGDDLVSATDGAHRSLTPVHLTCMKTGERISGLNKICNYDCGGSEASQTVRSTGICPVNMQIRGGQQPQGNQSTRPRGAACFRTGERTSGMNKVCSYDCGGSGREVTVGSAQLCPLNPR